MRTVIYDAELMEPITIVDIPPHIFAGVEHGAFRNVSIPIYPRISAAASTYADAPIECSTPPRCQVRFEPVRRNGGVMFWLCITEDGESALLLRSVFLPGQQKELSEERREAFLRGVHHVFQHFKA